MKRYIIRTQDIFDAIACGQLKHDGNYGFQIGALWATLSLTDEERKGYTFPIDILK